MVLHPDGPSPHPYWYAYIIGIFHAMVNHPTLPDGTCMDFLWVHWYGSDFDQEDNSGFKAQHLHQIGFLADTDDPQASPPFGFVDPSNVIHSVYLPPVFNQGKRGDLLGPSVACSPSQGDEDFCLDYVDLWVDFNSPVK
jgi:hypothetical protein